MISVERGVACSGDICSIWNAVGDTERINRAIGNNAVAMEALDADSAARFTASTKLGGFQVTYEERPYEWVYLERFSVLRKMLSGPMKSLEALYTFATTPSGGTQVTVSLRMEPRSWVLAPAVRLSAQRVVGRMLREIERMDAAIKAGLQVPPLAPLHAANEQELERALHQLERTADVALARRLADFLRKGGDLDVARIRPFQLADEWKVDRRLLLTTCLLGVRAGLLELHWDLICPSCRTVSESLPSLASLADHGRCQLCDIDFGLDLDEAVEATFSPVSRIRKVDDRKYCIGGPARTPHVFAQMILPAASSGALRAPLEEGRFRLFARGGEMSPVVVKPGAPSEVTVTIGQTQPIELAPLGRLVVRNLGGERHIKLERIDWLSQAASARVLSTLPAFRREFSSEVLRPGTSLKVARVTILFTDLTDSTKLYASIGDASAFRLVHDHFDVLFPLIEKHEGAMVKTIGDAIMAVFAGEDGAVQAAVEMLEAFERFRRDQPNGNATHIKIGMFTGPCFAINANGVLDYFGQSVNVAARLQGQAKSGEVVLEAEAAATAAARGLLGRAHVAAQEQVTLKGVDGTTTIARIALR